MFLTDKIAGKAFCGRAILSHNKLVIFSSTPAAAPSSAAKLDFGNKRKANSRRSILSDLDGNRTPEKSPKRLSPVTQVC